MASKTSRTFVWIILGLVMIGLVGFGSTNFGNSARSVGKVGDTEIDATLFAREVSNTLRAFTQQTGQPITIAQAQTFGLTNQALERVIASAAFDNEASRLGISIGDERLRAQVMAMPDFQDMSSGVFTTDRYEFILRNAGLTAKEFETNLRADMARALLQEAVSGGVAPPTAFTDALFSFARETRDFTWAKLDLAALETQPAAPTEAALEAYYQANPEAYTLPEIKRLTAIWLRPESLVDSVAVDEADLRKLYQARADIYDRPERRLVERLVFANDAEAQAAIDAINAGETTFAKLVEARGLKLSDTDMGDVSQDDLGDAGDGVFALTEPGVAGPLPSPLGPALYNMNAILAAQYTPFEEVRDELRAEFASEEAQRAVGDMIGDLDDQLAGGVTLEELANTTPGMELLRLDWTPDSAGGLADYDAFRQAATSAGEGDFPQLETLSDGGLFALRVDKVEPPRLQDLDEVRDQVVEAVRLQDRLKALEAQAKELIARLTGSGESLASLGLTEITETGRARGDLIEGTPPALLDEVFSAPAPGQWQLVPDADGVILVRLDRITPADHGTDEARAAKAAFSQQAAQQIGLDIQGTYSRALQETAGITLNQAVINAVLSSFP